LRRLAPWLAALSFFVPASAEAARITGRVDGFRNLLNPVWAESRDPKNHGYSFREPVPTVRAEFRRLFPHVPKEICVAAIAATPQKAGGPVEVRVGGGRTTPVTIVVAPGTLLRFQNTDAFKHRLYGVDIKTFQPADTPRGGKREWTVSEPGIFEIRDELAPSLRTWVIADPNVAAIVYPSLKGDFALTVAEPGDYTVQAFFAGKKVGPAVPVTVATADIDISRSPLKVGDEKAAAAADKAQAEKEKAEKAEPEKAGGEKK
jgi:plastocyanin